MSCDQRLEHFGKAFGGAFRPETLNAEAGALAQQEKFIGEKLGIAQSCFSAELDDQVAVPVLVFLDHPPGGVISVR